MTLILLYACAFFAIIELVRALPWPRGWLQRKPLGCDVCLTWWCAITFYAIQYDDTPSPLPFIAAAGITLLMYSWLRKSELVPPAL